MGLQGKGISFEEFSILYSPSLPSNDCLPLGYVNAKGSATSSRSKSRSITARVIIPATRTSKMVVAPSFTKVLYLTLDDSVAPIKDAMSALLGMLGNGTSSTYPAGTAGAGRISSNCTFKGKFLGGRVKIVEVGADFTVKVVNSFEDFSIKFDDFRSGIP